MHSLNESLPPSALALEGEGDDEDEDGDEALEALEVEGEDEDEDGDKAGQEKAARGQVTEVKHLQGGRGLVGAATNEHMEKEDR